MAVVKPSVSRIGASPSRYRRLRTVARGVADGAALGRRESYENVFHVGGPEHCETSGGADSCASSELEQNLGSLPTLSSRKTKIVATIGPSTMSRETFFELARAGLNVARINFSHGSHASHKEVIDMVKDYNASNGAIEKIGILLDTKGPEVRSGDLKSQLLLEPGKEYTFSSSPSADGSDGVTIGINFDGFVNDVEEGDVLLVDGGEMTLAIEGKNSTDIFCRCIEGGTLKSRRHLNVRGKSASLPSITEKDWHDIDFGVREGVDFFALSFVKDAHVVNEVKQYIKDKGSHALVLPKIESADSVTHLDEILAASDGAMVARGDLGAELPVEEVPMIQNRIIYNCWKLGTPVIVATNMLESMIHNPTPTRAEVSDIALAVREGTDAVMLSGETANGKYPIKAFEVMQQTCVRTEQAMSDCTYGTNLTTSLTESGQCLNDTFSMGLPRMASQMPSFAQETTLTDKTSPKSNMLAHNAISMANNIDAPIVLFTRTGGMAALVAHYRPKQRIFAFTDNDVVLRRLSLIHGITALPLEFQPTFDCTFTRAVNILQERGAVEIDDNLILLQSGKRSIWRENTTHIIQLYKVGSDSGCDDNSFSMSRRSRLDSIEAELSP